jgi:myosin-5
MISLRYPILMSPQVRFFYIYRHRCLQCSRVVLHTIRNRYAQHSIYTYSGIVLIAMNPFQRITQYGPEIIQAYSGRRRGELEPHLFAIAEDAYTAMRKEGTGQTIIVSGERYVG